MAHIVAQPESAPLEGGIKLVGVVGPVIVEVHDAAVQLAHVLDNRLRNETAFNQALEKTFRDPLGILDIALPAWKLLDEVIRKWIY